MPSISNIFAAIFSFFIGVILLYVFDTIMIELFALFPAGLLKLIIQGAWWFMVVLTLIYFPIMMLTSEDKVNNPIQ